MISLEEFLYKMAGLFTSNTVSINFLVIVVLYK